MKNLKEYVKNLCKESYGLSDEDTETVVEAVSEYAEYKGLTSLNEVDVYMDGLFTNLDINTGEV
jgi:hypothetical protein